MKCDDCVKADEHEMFTRCKLDGEIKYKIQSCLNYKKGQLVQR